MKDLIVKDVLRIGNGVLLCGNEEQVLGNICSDTRKLEPGDVYVGICGEKFDGNAFCKEALAKGASICIVERVDEEEIKGFLTSKTIILVENSIACLQRLAQYKREQYDIPVIAITGSVGKTSTKDMIYSVVSQKYKTHKTFANLNNHIGVPLTILGLRDHEALVIELGMNHAGELSKLSKIVKPTMVVITNVGTAHIENLGSRENILKAKLEILEGMIGNKVFLNKDNDLLRGEVENLKKTYQVTTVGIDEASEYQAENIREDGMSSVFDIVGKVKEVRVEVGGKAFVYNALMAYAVGEELDISDKLIRRGISSFVLSSHRLEKKISPGGIIVIDDTYNANYDSMKASLEVLGKAKQHRKIAILGDMLELGEYAMSIHREIGDVVYANDITILVTVGKHAKEIGKRVIELGMPEEKVFSFAKEEETHEFLEGLLQPDDVVLVKGSHGVKLINVVKAIMTF